MNLGALIQQRQIIPESGQATRKSKITNERQLVMKDFLDRLNPPRIASGYRNLSPGRLGMMMRHMTTSQMKVFYGECKYANDFSKYFWYMMNPKNYD